MVRGRLRRLVGAAVLVGLCVGQGAAQVGSRPAAPTGFQVIVRPATPAPTVTITVPTASPTYDAGTATTLAVSGTASTLLGIQRCTWTNSLGGSGTAVGTTPTWAIAVVALTVGANVVTVSCTDGALQVGVAIITVTRSSALGSNPIDAARRIDWSTAGVAGGIPARATQCGATIAAYTGTGGTINTAIQTCTAGQHVQLGTGTFTLSTGITFNNKSNVTVRGNGANNTRLIFSNGDGCHGTASNVCMDSSDTNYFGGPSNSAGWSGPYTRGTTTITLSTAANLQVGWPLTLDQLKDGSDSGDIYICENSNCSGGSSGAARTNRDQQQIVTVVSCSPACPNGGSTSVTITPGLYMPNWRTGQTPQAWWPTGPIFNAGIEAVSIESTGADGASAELQFFNCNGCWAKGIRSMNPARSHVICWQSTRTTVRDSYFFETQSHLSSSYGWEPFGCGDSLVENNIWQKVTAPMPVNSSCSGCAFTYNFTINDTFASAGFFNPSFFLHAVADFVLFEGNIGGGIYSDNFHGSHHLMTAFRNRFDGYELNDGAVTSGNTVPLILFAYSRFYNIVGNVLGSTGRPHIKYQADIGSPGSPDQSIYIVDLGNHAQSPEVILDDTNVQRTLLRWGNYDIVTGTSRFVAGEVPSAIATLPNPLPADQTLPASQYLTVKPSWMGSVTWPGIGPDITGGDITGVGGHAFKNNAQVCYEAMGGNANGTGGVLTFSAATCYP